MKEKIKKINLMLIVGILFVLFSCSTNDNIILNEEKITLINREFDSINSPESNIISLDRQNSSGLAVLEEIEFSTGSIEVSLLGENLQGKSFIGIAFNIQNDSTYETVYFRAFNFESDEKIRREHCMQYVFEPEFPWHKLRKKHEGKFEAEFINPPDPDDWFTIIIKIRPRKIEVLDKRTNLTLMVVDRLTETKSNKIGFWTGYGSKGSFKNLKINKSEN